MKIPWIVLAGMAGAASARGERINHEGRLLGPEPVVAAPVPDARPPGPLRFLDSPDESDPSPYPIPSNMPVETWPRETGALTLLQWQQDVNNTGGDRHGIVVMPGAGSIWETWQARLAGT